MLPKVWKSAKGCSKCKIHLVLQTQKSAQKVLSVIGKGLCTHEILIIIHFISHHLTIFGLVPLSPSQKKPQPSTSTLMDVSFLVISSNP